MFTSTREPNSKRVFCGYCGTHLTYWCETPEAEAQYLNITVGSIFGDDIRTLEQLGLLSSSGEAPSSREAPKETPEQSSPPAQSHTDDDLQNTVSRSAQDGLEWMEDMLNGTWLGKFHQTHRRIGLGGDRTTQIEWEITEISGNVSESETGAGRGKRKLEAVGSGEDASMQL